LDFVFQKCRKSAEQFILNANESQQGSIPGEALDFACRGLSQGHFASEGEVSLESDSLTCNGTNKPSDAT
jgi:hypothetical protein